MAYTKKYFLERVRAVNEVYKQYSALGVPNERIYRKHIKPMFYISRSTFYEYLTIPYAAELRKIEEGERAQGRLF